MLSGNASVTAGYCAERDCVDMYSVFELTLGT